MSTQLPQPHPTRATGRESRAREIVTSDSSHITALAVDPADQRDAIAQWGQCIPGSSCIGQNEAALAVTDDGFETQTVVDLPTTRDPTGYVVTPAGHDFLVSHWGRDDLHLVDSRGQARPVVVSAEATALARGEVLVSAGRQGALAVNPAAATAHPLATPPGTTHVQAAGSQLLATSRTGAVQWSGDSGRTWEPVPGIAHDAITDLAVSPTASVTAILVGRPGASVPWTHTMRRTSGGWVSQPVADNPRPRIDPDSAIVTPDGAIAALVTWWSSWNHGDTSLLPGYYTVSSDGTPHSMASAGTSPWASAGQPRSLQVATFSGKVYLWVTNGSVVYKSDDAGVTWQRQPTSH